MARCTYWSNCGIIYGDYQPLSGGMRPSLWEKFHACYVNPGVKPMTVRIISSRGKPITGFLNDCAVKLQSIFLGKYPQICAVLTMGLESFLLQWINAETQTCQSVKFK